ncbi:MAG TPA: acyl-CoA dehydrogenase family protein, partial [Flavobacteriaceae bacterium]|nr:acyl-CoA dehydrogenase family protein [Flavobacteriaceae bacterium]
MSLFGKIRKSIQLFKEIDMDKLAAINEKIDLSEAMKSLGELDERELKGMMKLLQSKGKKGQHKLPPIKADFYNLDLKLTKEERELQLKIRNFMEEEIRPLANKSWYNGKFPYEIIDKFKKLDITGI